MSERKLPEIERHCPKCNGEKAYGPEYRRGVGTDQGLGEHLRYYCTVCRYLTAEPTKDGDTPERRRELAAAFDARRQAQNDRNFNRDSQEQRDIEDTRRSLMNRRPYRGGN